MIKKRVSQVIAYIFLALFLGACASTGHQSKRVKCPPHSSLMVPSNQMIC